MKSLAKSLVMDLKVIDNFLPKQYFRQIKDLMMSANFPWYYNDGVIFEGDGQYQFTHNFFISQTDIYSEFITLFEIFFEMLGVKKLHRVKANLNTRTSFNEKTGYHYDYPDMRTAVFYVNDNNGGTEFKNGKFVKSKENRIVIFDSNLIHTGVTCNDEKMRVVVNFNYEH